MKSFYSLFIAFLVLFSCAKKHDVPPVTEDPATNDSTIIDPVDPPVSSTMGLFLDGWQPRTYIAPQFTEGTIAPISGTIVTVDAANVITKIPLTVFGHNANNWMSRMYNDCLLYTSPSPRD